ncbi:hypothetical protein GCM10023187_37510 [Nibrella viscosa]|uniref:Adhesin domain-containing protein n=1 Tax=Nibrella viscosa TaxID=1084524 RepID=A0ABP8KP32_9BACT
MKTLCKVLLVCLLPMQLLAAQTGLVEKRKTIIKLYDVTAKDNLLVENQFGQVKVGLWDKNEIRVQITITANSSSETMVQQYLDAVDIEEKRNGDQISLRTIINKGSASNWRMGTWRSKDGQEESNSVRIDYDITMPRSNALNVKNRFGNTDIQAFRAPLTVHQRYGTFYATELTGRQNDINVAYGKADIRKLENGKLIIAYSTLDLDQANVLMLDNKFGKLKIGEVGRIEGNIDYSGAKIGTVRQSCNIKLDFSGGFKIEQLPKSVDDVKINANYSSVVLPASDDVNYDFDVTVTHGGFRYANDSKIKFRTQPNEDESRRGPVTTRQYAGQIGQGTGPKVIVVAKFGDVSLR